jgi:hypothetical protein
VRYSISLELHFKVEHPTLCAETEFVATAGRRAILTYYTNNREEKPRVYEPQAVLWNPTSCVFHPPIDENVASPPRNQLSQDGTNELREHLKANRTRSESELSSKNLLEFRFIRVYIPRGLTWGTKTVYASR